MAKDKLGRFVKGTEPWNKGMKGFIHSGTFKKGHKVSKETRLKMSNAHKGQIAWNKGTKGIIKSNKGSFKKGQISWNKGIKCPQISNKLMGRILSKEHKKKISLANIGKVGWMRGKKHSDETKKKISIAKTNPSVETRKKMSKAKKGKLLTTEHRRKIGEAHKGEKSWNWKGGITPLNKLLRRKSMWKIWREAVFLRDNFICQNPNCVFCNNKQGVLLHPHHIKPLAIYPELVFRIDNGITYCAEFHLKSGLHVGIQKMQRMC